MLATWRKAGFQKLKDGVVWLPTGHGYDQYPDHGELSRDLIEKGQVLAQQERFKASWRRRVRRQLP